MTYTNILKRNFNSYDVKKAGARISIAAGLALMLFGITFAQQSGIGLASRLADHQHTGAGDGAQLMGLNPVGNFYINTNSEGNIVIASAPTGGVFYWRPKRQAFRAGLASDDSFYDINVGSYSWAGGYNSSAGSYSLGFGTYVKADRVANIALGYYLKSTAGNTITLGSGPGFGMNAYAVNDATGSIQFFPFTITSSTEPMLALYRDGNARATGVWNFTSSPTINGIALSTYSAVDNTKVLKTGDTMTGPLIMSTPTAATAVTVHAANGYNVMDLYAAPSYTNTSYGLRLKAGTSSSDYAASFRSGANDEFFRIRGDGNIGVGIAAPSRKFTIYDASQPGILLNNSTTGTGASDGVFFYSSGNDAYIINQEAAALKLGVDDSADLTITSGGSVTLASTLTVSGNAFSVGGSTLSVRSGSVGVGVVAADMVSAKLTVESSINITNTGGSGRGLLLAYDDSGNTAGKIVNAFNSDSATIDWYMKGISAGNKVMTLNGAGKLGIGTTAPVEKLDVVGGIRATKNKISAEGGILVLAYNDTGLTVASGTIVNSTGSTSDYGFKINPIGAAQSWGAVYGSSSTTTMGSCAAGTWCWVCVSGLCGVNVDAGGCATRGLWVGASSTVAGAAECVAEPSGVAQHDREIGHNVIATPAGSQAWIMAQFGR